MKVAFAVTLLFALASPAFGLLCCHYVSSGSPCTEYGTCDSTCSFFDFSTFASLEGSQSSSSCSSTGASCTDYTPQCSTPSPTPTPSPTTGEGEGSTSTTGTCSTDFTEPIPNLPSDFTADVTESISMSGMFSLPPMSYSGKYYYSNTQQRSLFKAGSIASNDLYVQFNDNSKLYKELTVTPPSGSGSSESCSVQDSTQVFPMQVPTASMNVMDMSFTVSYCGDDTVDSVAVKHWTASVNMAGVGDLTIDYYVTTDASPVLKKVSFTSKMSSGGMDMDVTTTMDFSNVQAGSVDSSVFTIDPSWNCGGTVTVNVQDDGLLPVSGATVKLIGELPGSDYTLTTDANGQIVQSNALPGTYSASISKSGFNTIIESISVVATKSVTETYTILPDVDLCILVVSVMTGNPVSGVSVAGNTVSNALTTQTTGSDGTVRFSSLATGTIVTLSLSKSGYISYSAPVVSGIPTCIIVPISPTIETTQARVVLTWGQQPYDLDSHSILSNGDTCYWASRSVSGTPGCSLDRDDTNSYGPETTTWTVDSTKSETFTFYVYNYSGSPTAMTDALVRVYLGNGQYKEYKYADATQTDSSGRFWNVFKMDSSFTLTDCMTQTASQTC
eukprot:CAMPEP_0113880596 /NCGR_PEP_ID=MMETSP0780_2-20120614/7878_1 /TAXON_ID=652834 /ORGANISM="Palpitomonas bilix" /LENGTH=613 /DNA_ID=CAMNT_0000867299 /DNA_START=52 /DNA_END=1893 /DNA_ORIENTATION=+ /assembly_acc=CAM_ASM_000599